MAGGHRNMRNCIKGSVENQCYRGNRIISLNNLIFSYTLDPSKILFKTLEEANHCKAERWHQYQVNGRPSLVIDLCAHCPALPQPHSYWA